MLALVSFMPNTTVGASETVLLPPSLVNDLGEARTLLGLGPWEVAGKGSEELSPCLEWSHPSPGSLS